MLVSKIVPGETYAIRKAKGSPLIRFRVTKISTVRAETGSKSVITGTSIDLDAHDPFEMQADKILGPYADFAELVEREAKERAERKAQETAEKADAEELVRKLYGITGIAMPNDLRSFDRRPFEMDGYAGRVNLGSEGVRALLKLIKSKGL